MYDDIEWNGEKVQRRVPTCLDIAFAALGNDQVVNELVARMTDNNGREFRDGLNYQHNLAAVRDVIDEQNKAVWEENIYMNWLATLRELSAPTTDHKYPEAMRTRASAMKTLNTQLASWTQLRHDTILYVKQSITCGELCYYPAGFVEPRPAFWERFEKMALLAAELIEKTSFPKRSSENDDRYEVPLQYIKERQAKFFKNFAQNLTILKGIAQKELVQEEFTQEETQFLEHVVQLGRGSGSRFYTGWYPSLFYKGIEDCDKQDAIVADVHTNVPAQLIGDPGCVLHQGVGDIDLLMIAVDNGKDKMVYAGPVLSHYEFEMPGVSRKSDSDWRYDLEIGNVPPRPEWTRSYLVPKDYSRKFANLTSLDLSSKQLTALPKDICRLTQLTSLNLRGNQITVLPPEIGQLTNLRQLNLGGNRLTTLPPEIGQLTNLTTLDLRGNQLTLLPSEIGQLTNLTELNLSNLEYENRNKLTSLPSEIGKLTNLKTLDLWGNQLTTLPPEIGHLIKLTKLDLSKNQLTALPKEIGQLTYLAELDLKDNQLTVLPQEIGQLPNLIKLNLSDNQLTKLPPEIGQLPILKHLYLHNNQLTTLPHEIGQISQLTLLQLCCNKLTALPPEITQLTNLKQLYLHNNPELTALPNTISQFANLTALSDNNTPRTKLLGLWYLCENVYKLAGMV